MERNFMKLDVWKQAHLLVLEVYKSSKKLPESQRDGLGADVCNSALAIPAKIAVGCGCLEDAEFRKSLETAVMSSRELDIQLMVSQDLGYLSSREVERLLKMTEEVRNLLREQISKLRVSSSKSGRM